MIGCLIDHLDMLKTNFVIVPEHAPSEETVKNNDAKEDKDDVKEDNFTMVRRSKMLINKCDRNVGKNGRSDHEVMESEKE